MERDKKLVNFNVNHHETLHISYSEKIKWWHNETDIEKRRCKACWLRTSQCFCSVLHKKRDVYEAWTPKPNINVCIYYNSIEIARTANTAHSLEVTCPSICNSLVYGDLANEVKLLDDIQREYEEGQPQTCIMFPSNSAMLLSEWMQARPATCADKPIRLIMLDGTFPGASRQAKYLMGCCAVRGIPAPLVKLDLEGGACKSAVAGMMYQPGKDKICTYQAIVMAMEQAKVNPAFCNSLHRDLEDWIAYILKSKVKLGKSKPRNSMKTVMDITPTDLIANALKDKLAAAAAAPANPARHSSHNSNLHKKARKLGEPVQANPLLTAQVVVQRTRRFSVVVAVVA